MDPSKTTSGADETEASSLEGTDTVVETGKEESKPAAEAKSETNVTDATHGVAPAPPPAANKPPLIKRLWRKFNVYLLLFLLVILIFVGVTVAFYVKNNSDPGKTQETIDSQNLSEEAAKQLSSSSVTVGSSKQILNVASNAVFGGSVLVRSDLEVAGDIKLGGTLDLPGMAVTGASKFGQLQTDTLSVTADATVQGSLTVRKGMSVLGTSTFGSISAAQVSTNALQLNGALILTHHITAGGPIPDSSRGTALGSGGTASANGSDLAGSITINTGSGPGAGCFINVTFVRKYDGVPHVVVTPIGSAAAGIDYYVNRSTTGFSVCTTSPAPGNETFGFDYIIFG
jgi:hypothetical protein